MKVATQAVRRSSKRRAGFPESSADRSGNRSRLHLVSRSRAKQSIEANTQIPAGVPIKGETTMKKLVISAVAAAVLGLTTLHANAYQRWFDVVNQSNRTIVA